jgi:RnfABCDGE-type electron transport complex G subunit
MKDAVRFPLVLGVISVLSAVTLGFTYSATREQIELQAMLARNRALVGVLGVEVESPENPPWMEVKYSDETGRLGDFAVYEVAGPSGGSLYATIGAGQGYSSKVRVMVAFDSAIEQGPEQAVIRAASVVSQLETPGLGSKCQGEDFQRQFSRLPLRLLGIDRSLTGYRDPDGEGEQKIAAITGATITTNATLAAIRQAAGRVRYHIEQKTTGE